MKKVDIRPKFWGHCHNERAAGIQLHEGVCLKLYNRLYHTFITHDMGGGNWSFGPTLERDLGGIEDETT